MSHGKRPSITPMENGPFVVEGLSKISRMADGKELDCRDTVALCRCGGSKSKPFCDGTHSSNGFSSAKDENRVPDRRESYEGDGIVVHDNRGICAHAGRCTDGLPSVFRLRKEPFVDARGASAEAIARTIEQCPSGALRYTTEGVERPASEGDSAIAFAPNGPYVVTGGAELKAALGEGATTDRLTLCRCGASTNKPFCSGAHWDVSFDEDAQSTAD